MDRTVSCVATSEVVAAEIVSRLQSAGYGDDDICILRAHAGEAAMPPRERAPHHSRSAGRSAGNPCAPEASHGPFRAANGCRFADWAHGGGPATGSPNGRPTHAFITTLIPEQDLQRLEGKAEDGTILIAIHTENGAEVQEVEDAFGVAGATQIDRGGPP